MKKNHSSFFYEHGFTLIEVMFVIAITSLVALVVNSLSKTTAAISERNTLVNNVDQGQLIALRKSQESGYLNAQIKSELNNTSPYLYDEFLACLQGSGSQCISKFDTLKIKIGRNENQLKEEMNSSFDFKNESCSDPLSCEGKKYERNTFVIIACESNFLCSGVSLKVETSPENLNSASKNTPIAQRAIEIQIPAYSLLSSGLQGSCGDKVASGINQATNQISCLPVRDVASTQEEENTCATQVNPNNVSIGVKEAGFNNKGCQTLKLASWSDVASWPAPARAKPNISLKSSLSSPDIIEENLPIEGDLYLIVDTSGSLTSFRQQMASQVASLVAKAVNSPGNHINVYAYPISSSDNESISNVLQSSTTPVPNSNKFLNYYKMKLNDPFLEISSDTKVTPDEISAYVLNKFQNAPQPAMNYSGESRETGLCALNRILAKEFDEAASGTNKNPDRKKFFVLISDERDDLEKNNPKGFPIIGTVFGGCTYDFKDYYHYEHVEAKENSYYKSLATVKVSELNTIKPETAERKLIYYSMPAAFLYTSYKVYGNDGGVNTTEYPIMLYINPQEYDIKPNATKSDAACPENLKADMIRYTESYARDRRNVYGATYYNSNVRKAEAVDWGKCLISYNYSTHVQTTSYKSDFSNPDDFYAFNPRIHSGKVRAGPFYLEETDPSYNFSNFNDYITNAPPMGNSGNALETFKFQAADKALMQDPNENYIDYVNRVKTFTRNNISDWFIDELVSFDYQYLFNYTMPAYDTTVGDGTRIYRNITKLFIDNLGLSSYPNTEEDISLITKKSLDYIYKNNYSLISLTPTENSSGCGNTANEYSLHYDTLVKEIKKDNPKRAELIDICQTNQYKDAFDKVESFFKVRKNYSIKSYDYEVKVEDLTLFSQLKEYLDSNGTAHFAIIMSSLNDETKVGDEANTLKLLQGDDFDVEVIDSTLKIHFHNDAKITQALIVYQNFELILEE